MRNNFDDETDGFRRMTVLVIAYYFPPMGLSGVQRTLKFVKYLAEFGWKPIVITAGEMPYYASDETLLEEIAPLIERGEVEIVRTESAGLPGKGKNGILKLPGAAYQRFRSKLLQTFLQPDSRIGWKKHALKAIDAIYARENIDAIFSTAPPYTDFLIAKEVRAKYGTPYLMDYRDAWVSNPVLNFYATPFHKAYAAKLEDECLRASDAVTVVNRGMKEVLLNNYNFLNHEDVRILPHGFDPEDFERAAPFAGHVGAKEKFRITYSGTFYVGRSPKVFLEGVCAAVAQAPGLKKDLELLFVGVLQKEYYKLIQRLGLEGNSVVRGYVAHRESVGLLLSSDVLWMTMSDDISAPGKLYEYFGARKPILGLVPKDSQAARMLIDYGAAIITAPDDSAGVTEAILTLYELWKRDALGFDVNESFVQGFDRRMLTRDLARVLRTIAHPITA
ncbi:MAG: glycosyltransferase family 4 protein [Candidatus Kapaibacterium sp.]